MPSENRPEKILKEMAVYEKILEKYSGARRRPGSTLARRPTAVFPRENRDRAARKERVDIHGIRSCASLSGSGAFQSTPGVRRSHGVASPGPGSVRTVQMRFGARMNGISRAEIGITTRLRDKLISPTAAPTMPCGAGSSIAYFTRFQNIPILH